MADLCSLISPSNAQSLHVHGDLRVFESRTQPLYTLNSHGVTLVLSFIFVCNAQDASVLYGEALEFAEFA